MQTIDVPILEFHEANPSILEDTGGFFCIIRHPINEHHPNGESSFVILNSDYDVAIKQFLNLVDIQTKYYQSLNILP